MDNEIVLFDARRYKRNPGFVKVQCLLQESLDDFDLKEEIVRSLLDTPTPERGVELLEKICRATKGSALRVCLEIAHDLYEGCAEINPAEEEEDDARPIKASDPDQALQQILLAEKTRRQPRPRHSGVSLKSYTYDRVYFFYTDPKKLQDADTIRIVR